MHSREIEISDDIIFDAKIKIPCHDELAAG
jgi:hypothetical protein